MKRFGLWIDGQSFCKVRNSRYDGHSFLFSCHGRVDDKKNVGLLITGLSHQLL